MTRWTPVRRATSLICVAAGPTVLCSSTLLAGPESDEAAIGEVLARYGLDLDFGTIPALVERHGLRMG